MKKFFFILLLALAVSCVPKGDYNTLRLKVLNQEQRLADLQKKQDVAREQMTGVQPAQADLWAEVKEMRGTLAGMEGKLDAMDKEVRAIAESHGNTTVILSGLAQEVGDMRFQFSQVVSQLALELEPSPTASKADSPTPSNATPERTQKPSAAKQPQAKADPAKTLYNQAFEEFKAQNYTIARSMWEEFANTFPKHALLPNALFWQGECYYQVGKYDEAILKYQTVIEQHPKSDKYPASLLKQGVSFLRTGKKKPGSYLLQELIKRYPKAPEARQANYYLKKFK